MEPKWARRQAPATSRTEQTPRWRRVVTVTWTVLKKAGAGALAVAALVISIIALQDQQAVNADARNSARRAEADLVSYYPTPNSPSAVTVVNLGSKPVWDLFLDANVDYNPPNTYEWAMYLGTLPECTAETFDILQDSGPPPLGMGRIGPADGWTARATSLTFVDNSDHVWTLGAGPEDVPVPGNLRKIMASNATRAVAHSPGSAITAQKTFTPAGCS